eukprot:GHUV01004866.1.p1 GENE.GHUV01004866.1~~GHUV01004866.1.p1  ORF type:complete len:180 (+),score=33.71 GHUV01004866.1:151-690(+)
MSALRTVASDTNCCSSRAACAPSCSLAATIVPPRNRVSSSVRTPHRQQYPTLLLSRPRRTLVARAMMAGGTGMAPQLKQAIDTLIEQNKIVVFMKGTKQFPQCGFSNTVVQILRTLDAEFETVNILENEMLRSGMKEYSQWPTFPQVYVDGEFYGGCDIMIESYNSGELAETLERLKNE